MANNKLDLENDVFSCKQTDGVALIAFKRNIIALLTDQEVKDAFISTFSMIDNSQKINGVVITTTPSYTGGKNLKAMLTHILESLEYPRQDIAIDRFKNSMRQLVNLFINSTKPTVAALSGDIGQVLYGLSLACDFRYSTPNTIFHFPTLKLGLPTTGVLAFYLTHYIGLPRSIDMLFTKTSLSAPEARDLGLLTDVTTNEELVSRSIEKLYTISQFPGYAITGMKRLLRPDTNEVFKSIDRAFETFFLNINDIKKALADSR